MEGRGVELDLLDRVGRGYEFESGPDTTQGVDANCSLGPAALGSRTADFHCRKPCPVGWQ